MRAKLSLLYKYTYVCVCVCAFVCVCRYMREKYILRKAQILYTLVANVSPVMASSVQSYANYKFIQ